MTQDMDQVRRAIESATADMAALRVATMQRFSGLEQAVNDMRTDISTAVNRVRSEVMSRYEASLDLQFPFTHSISEFPRLGRMRSFVRIPQAQWK
jgi:DNA-binding FadR family transcriptional regulator